MGNSQALRLHRMGSMKLATVAILAALALTACGVGYDEQQPEASGGAPANTLRASALTGSSSAVEKNSGNYGGSIVDPTRASPQDPIPMQPTSLPRPPNSDTRVIRNG